MKINKSLIIVFIILIICVGAFLVYIGVPLQLVVRTAISTSPLYTTQLPIESWSIYSNDSPKFKIRYPSDFAYTVSSNITNPLNVSVVTFKPLDQKFIASVIALKVMETKGAKSVEEWVSKYASPTESDTEKTKNVGYLAFSASNLATTQINGKNLTSYNSDTPTGGKTEGIFVFTDKYVFALEGLLGKDTDIKQKMALSIEM